MQILSDHEELLQKLEDGTSEFCCFENTHDFLTGSVLFEENEDPVVAARHIFVRTLTQKQRHLKKCLK